MEQRFGPYFLLRLIASGGMAEVYLARTGAASGQDRLVALKMLPSDLSADQEFIEGLVEEARLSVQLHHPSIASIFDLGRIDGIYHISMEFVDGADLFRLLVRTSDAGQFIPLESVAHIGREVALALDHAHTLTDEQGRPLNIVHRDVSPQNLLLGWDGAVKLCDFGIAKAASRQSRTLAGVIKGKFSYMSPEQARGDDVDARSDIFSAGVCLWEALCGEMLHQVDDPMALLDQVRRADIDPPSSRRSEVPPELDRIVLRALARDRAERYQRAGDLAADLGNWLEGRNPELSAPRLGDLLRRSFPELEPMDAALSAPAPPPAMEVLDDKTSERPAMLEWTPFETREVAPMASGEFSPSPEHSVIFDVSRLRDRAGDDQQGDSGPSMTDDSNRPPGPPERTRMLDQKEVLAAAEAESAEFLDSPYDDDLEPTLPPGALSSAALKEALDQVAAQGAASAAPEALEPPSKPPNLSAATVMMDAKALAAFTEEPALDDTEDSAPEGAGAAAESPFDQKTAFLSTEDPKIQAILNKARAAHAELTGKPLAPPPDEPAPAPTAAASPSPVPDHAKPTVAALAPPLEPAPAVKVIKVGESSAVPETVASRPAPALAETRAASEAPIKAEAKKATEAAPAEPASAKDKVAEAKARAAKKKGEAAPKKKAAKGAASADAPSKMGRRAKPGRAGWLSPGVILTFAGIIVFGGLTANYILSMFTAEYGTASITSDPPGAVIVFNGKDLKQKTPFEIKGLEVDKSHELTLRLEGHEEEEDVIDVVADETTRHHYMMRPVPGSLEITTEPAGATVYVDGAERGQSPVSVDDLPRDRDLPIVLKRKGYADKQLIHVWSQSGKRDEQIHVVLEKTSRGKRRRRRR
jgi:serine/threonine protein kinase